MPEGPSIVILKELVQEFTGKKILQTSGNAKIDTKQLINKKIIAFKSFGKHFLICTNSTTVRIHFLLFGSYSINEQTKPDKSLRLKLLLKNGALYFYTCSVKLLADNPDNIYDWSADIMSDEWDFRKAIKKLQLLPGTLVCDALLNQDIFAGAGNIIKNEVLYRTKIHPESLVDKIPPKKLTSLVKEVRNYSFDFLKWKKAFVLKQHWKAHTKKICERCDLPLVKKYAGKTKRRSFFAKIAR